MDIATWATALAVLNQRSVREAARHLGRPPSSVADAFERFEASLALKLAIPRKQGLSLTLAGEGLAQSILPVAGNFAAIARIAGIAASDPNDALIWASRQAISVTSLGNFSHVLSAGSIRSAAKRLGISQPALSRRMGRLEAVLGLSLLHRRGDGCEPTEAGLALDEEARALALRFRSLTGPAKARFAEEIRTVRLGTIIPFGHESQLATRLADLVAEWQERWPQQKLLLSSTTADELIEGLHAGRFDVALTDIAIRHSRLECRPLFSSELGLVSARTDVSGGDDLPQRLQERRLVLPSLKSGLRRRISEALEQIIDDPAVSLRILEVDTLPIVLNLVIKHGYLTVLPLDAIGSLRERLCMIRLPEAPRVVFHIVWQKNQSARGFANRIALALGVLEDGFPEAG